MWTDKSSGKFNLDRLLPAIDLFLSAIVNKSHFWALLVVSLALLRCGRAAGAEIDFVTLASLPPALRESFEKSPQAKRYAFSAHINPFIFMVISMATASRTRPFGSKSAQRAKAASLFFMAGLTGWSSLAPVAISAMAAMTFHGWMPGMSSAAARFDEEPMASRRRNCAAMPSWSSKANPPAR